MMTHQAPLQPLIGSITKTLIMTTCCQFHWLKSKYQKEAGVDEVEVEVEVEEDLIDLVRKVHRLDVT